MFVNIVFHTFLNSMYSVSNHTPGHMNEYIVQNALKPPKPFILPLKVTHIRAHHLACNITF